MIDLCNVDQKSSVQAMETMMSEFTKFIPSNPKSVQPVQSQESEAKTDDVSEWITFPYFHNCVGP